VVDHGLENTIARQLLADPGQGVVVSEYPHVDERRVRP
jgi:hypothetical protein